MRYNAQDVRGQISLLFCLVFVPNLDPDFDFISAAAPYLVEVKGTGRYLIDEMKKRLMFVYDPDDGILAKELALFKSLGFDPNAMKQ